MSPLPEIPASSLAAINISRSFQGYQKTPEGNMNLRVANLTKEKNFCTIWPWICRHVGIEIVGLLWNELATRNGSCQALLILKTITGLLAQQNLDTKQGNKKVTQNALLASYLEAAWFLVMKKALDYQDLGRQMQLTSTSWLYKWCKPPWWQQQRKAVASRPKLYHQQTKHLRQLRQQWVSVIPLRWVALQLHPWMTMDDPSPVVSEFCCKLDGGGK